VVANQQNAFRNCGTWAKKEVPYPYAKTREVRLAKITIASGKPLTISRHPEMVADMAIQSDRP
jgi:hypothetical protein